MVAVFLGALVPVAEPDLGCGDGRLGGERARKRARLDPAGEIVNGSPTEPSLAKIQKL
jgi:hypothetical protein